MKIILEILSYFCIVGGLMFALLTKNIKFFGYGMILCVLFSVLSFSINGKKDK